MLRRRAPGFAVRPRPLRSAPLGLRAKTLCKEPPVTDRREFLKRATLAAAARPARSP